MYISGTDISCGVKQLAGLHEIGFESWETRCRRLVNFVKRNRRNTAHVIFSDIDGPVRGGEQLALYINARTGLGQVTKSLIRRNPNTGNNIAVYVWSLPFRFRRVQQKPVIPQTVPRQKCVILG